MDRRNVKNHSIEQTLGKILPLVLVKNNRSLSPHFDLTFKLMLMDLYA
jgi:hypothetical protein